MFELSHLRRSPNPTGAAIRKDRSLIKLANNPVHDKILDYRLFSMNVLTQGA